MLLASAGWQPATSMLAVLKEVQQSLVDSGIEANTTVCVKKDSGCQCNKASQDFIRLEYLTQEYPKAAVQLQRRLACTKTRVK